MTFKWTAKVNFGSAQLLPFCRYNINTNKLTTYPPEKSIHATALFSMSGNGDMWFGSSDGYLKRFDTTTETLPGQMCFEHSPANAYLFKERPILPVETTPSL